MAGAQVRACCGHEMHVGPRGVHVSCSECSGAMMLGAWCTIFVHEHFDVQDGGRATFGEGAQLGWQDAWAPVKERALGASENEGWSGMPGGCEVPGLQEGVQLQVDGGRRTSEPKNYQQMNRSSSVGQPGAVRTTMCRMVSSVMASSGPSLVAI